MLGGVRLSLVSVIIPSYNYAKYIGACILSVFEQTYASVELIIVDDCSTDESVSIITELINSQKMQDRFSNTILVCNEKNRGAHYTINRGIELANGKYIAVLNADDLYECNRFEKMVALLMDTSSALAFSSVKVIDQDATPLCSEEALYFEGLPTKASSEDNLFFLLLQSNITVSTGNLLFEKALYLRLNGFRKFKYIHDWDFVLRALLVNEPVMCTDTHYYYRLHDANTFRSLQSIADIEVKMVLTDFFIEIKQGKFTNSHINQIDVKQKITKSFFEKIWKNAYIFYKIWLELQYFFKKFLLVLSVHK